MQAGLRQRGMLGACLEGAHLCCGCSAALTAQGLIAWCLSQQLGSNSGRHFPMSTWLAAGCCRGKMKPDDVKKKAVLLSGPPGIGKTSSALIVCRELGFEPVEVRGV